MSKYKAVATILLAAKTQIDALLTEPDEEMHRLKLGQTLQREADYIVMITGAGDIHTTETTVLGPAKTIGGQPISKVRKITEADLVPSDDVVFNLKQSVEEAWESFLYTDSGAILANEDQMVIRGVAKKAGLKVTKDSPKDITVEFINSIKEAIVKKEDGEDRGKLASNAAESEVDWDEQVDSALTYFGPNANAEGILENMPEPLIRAVARRAGLQVADEKPITADFIRGIQQALHGPSVTDAANAPGTTVILEEQQNVIDQAASSQTTGSEGANNSSKPADQQPSKPDNKKANKGGK